MYTRRTRPKCHSTQHLRMRDMAHGRSVPSTLTARLDNRNMVPQSHRFSDILPHFTFAPALVLKEVAVAHCISSYSGSESDCDGSEAFDSGNLGAYPQSGKEIMSLAELQTCYPQSGLRIGSLVHRETTHEHTCHPHNSSMQRERQRGISRRGSYSGRAPSQRHAPSPSSSIEVSSERRRTRGMPPGRERAADFQERMECGHSEHPMVRYRIPCTLSNSTSFVTVSVEHCSNPWGEDEAPQIPGMAPTVDMQLPAIEILRPVQDSLSPDPRAGPSEPVQRNDGKAIHQPPRCKKEDDP